MSNKDEQTKVFEAEVEVNEVETAELVTLEKEAKKAKAIEIAKKVGKVAGIVAIGVGGFLLGKSVVKNSDVNVAELIEVSLDNE